MQQYIEVLTEQEIKDILVKRKDEARLPEFTGERLDAVKKSARIAGYIESVRKCADEFRKRHNENLPFSKFKLYEESGNRLEAENEYFRTRVRLACFAIMALMYGRKEDIKELNDVIWAICDEYTWCLPAHLDGTGLKTLQYGDNFKVDLFQSETACALCEAVHFCGEYIHPIVKDRALTLARDRVVRVYEKNTYGWERWRTNWAAVCGGCVGMSAIYEEKEGYITVDELANILYRTQSTMQFFLEGFPSDGTCSEGITYWEYGFGYFTYYADVLMRRTCGDIDYFKIPHVKKIAEFHQKCFFPSGARVSFSDAGKEDTINYALISYLSDKYESVSTPRSSCGEMTFRDSSSRFARELRNILWDSQKEKKQEEVTKIYILRDLSWYIATSDDEKIDFAAKAGRNDEAHNHNDIGSFQLHKNGSEIFAELGGGEYTKEYFSPDRYNVFCCCSRGHSVPIIGGKYQAPGGQFRASEVSIDENGISMDMKGAYNDGNLAHFYRAFYFEKETGVLKITDSFEFAEKPETVCERFILYTEPEIGKNRATVSSEGKKEKMTLEAAGEDFDVNVEKVTHSLHNGRKIQIYCLDFTVRDKKAMKGKYEFTVR